MGLAPGEIGLTHGSFEGVEKLGKVIGRWPSLVFRWHLPSGRAIEDLDPSLEYMRIGKIEGGALQV